MTLPVPFQQTKIRPGGFTLIELLIVISILALLMGLLFPAVGGAIDAARKAEAKNAATQIAAAIQAFETEYGKMPGSTGGGDVSGNTDAILNALMPPNPSSPPPDNPRGIVFLEIPEAKSGKNGRVNGSGAYLDPWGNAYSIQIDGNYDYNVSTPYGEVRKRVAVWSVGKNNTVDSGSGRSDDIKSWE